MPLIITHGSPSALKEFGCQLCTEVGLNPDDVTQIVVHDDGTLTVTVDHVWTSDTDADTVPYFRRPAQFDTEPDIQDDMVQIYACPNCQEPT